MNPPHRQMNTASKRNSQINISCVKTGKDCLSSFGMVRHRHKYFVMARDREIRWQHLRVQFRSPHSNSRTDTNSLKYTCSDAHTRANIIFVYGYKLPSEVFHGCSISKLSIAILSFHVEGSKNPSIIRSFPCSYSIWWVSCLTSTGKGGRGEVTL